METPAAADTSRYRGRRSMGTFMTGSEVRRIREVHGLTQAQLAEVLGVAGSSVWAYEDGRRNVPKATARLLIYSEKKPGVLFMPVPQLADAPTAA